MPKGRKRGRAIGFCGADPLASIEGAGDTATPHRWINGEAVPLTHEDVRKLAAAGGSESQICGCWYSPKHDERALVWTRVGDGMESVELHPPGWDKSYAMACDGRQQVGYGYEQFSKQPRRALLWSGSRDSLVVLTGPDASRECYAQGVDDGMQVGGFGGSGRSHACLWHGTSESFVDLHPSGFMGSEATAIRHGQQVGIVWDEKTRTMRAALWTGTADSYVNLAPKGHKQSRPIRCGYGMQVGWIIKKDQGMLSRAVLWTGSDQDYLDLQAALPEPWTASSALDLHAEGTTLRVIGTAIQAVMQSGYEVNAGELPVIWEIRLKEAPPVRSRDVVPAVEKPAKRAQPPSAGGSAEQRIEKSAATFAQAIVDGTFAAAHVCLAPWVQNAMSAKQLVDLVRTSRFADVKPVDFQITGNDSTLAELRHSATIHDAVTPDNFRQWLWLDFIPEPGGDPLLDYCLRLYVIVVEVGGKMLIGYLEPGE